MPEYKVTYPTFPAIPQERFQEFKEDCLADMKASALMQKYGIGKHIAYTYRRQLKRLEVTNFKTEKLIINPPHPMLIGLKQMDIGVI